MSEKPSVWARIRSEAKTSSIALSIEPRTPAANTVTNETSASPIISAAAVAAVRPGLRTAFSRARRPGTPRSRSSGRPTRDAIGGTSSGLSMAAPRKTAPAPTPIQRPSGVSVAARPRMIAAIPSTASAIPITTRRREPVGVSSTAPSRSAAIGGTRVARIAGAIAATTVITVPTAIATMTVRDSITRPDAGRSIRSP